jgi:ornithine carbamoyltransferase
VKHLLKLLDLSSEEIFKILDLADKLKYERKHGIAHKRLEGKIMGLIFEKASTRTRTSFETGIFQLGGHALSLNVSDMQIRRGEPVEDTARVLSRYIDGIMIRTSSQSEIEALAEFGSIPVINGLTDFAHPCQVLADLMTIREYKGRLEGLNMCYIGDGNNMANSLIVAGLKTGMNVRVACPKGFEPAQTVLEFTKQYGEKFTLTTEPKDAAKNADVVLTDVWASMGQEHEREQRVRAFEGKYQVNDELLSYANEGCMVQHCLPAHKGEEITACVFEKHSDEIFDEAENRLHAQKAVMVLLLEDK